MTIALQDLRRKGQSIDFRLLFGRLVKLADTPDLGSGAERRRGSTPRATTFLFSGEKLLQILGAAPGSETRQEFRFCPEIAKSRDDFRYKKLHFCLICENRMHAFGDVDFDPHVDKILFQFGKHFVI